MQILLSSRFFLAHVIIGCERSLTLAGWDASARSLLNYLRLVSRVRRMRSNSSVARKIALIVVIILLILSEGIGWSILVEGAYSNGGTSMINIIACVASVNASGHIHSMCATSGCSPNKSAARSIIMLTTVVIELRWWSSRFIVLRISWWILSTILIAVTRYILSLIVESGMLRGRIIIKTVRSE